MNRALRRAYDSPCVRCGESVLLDGVDVTADLVGEISLDEAIGQPIRRGSLALRGDAYSPHRTVRTWTRTPIEIYTVQGPPGEELEVLTLRGIVDTCQMGSDGTVRLDFGDLGLLRQQICHVETPLQQGKTRGAIVRSIAAGAGYLADVPDGAQIQKPVESTGQDLFGLLGSFGEPEGWDFGVDNDGRLVADTYRLKTGAERPDHVWTLGDLYSVPEITPPTDVPSTWVLRGDTVSLVDEVGIETEVETVVVETISAPSVATRRQNPTTGALESTGAVPPPAILRPVSRLTTETRKQGQRVLSQVITEHAWHNPAHARLTTGNGDGLGPGDQGLYFVAANVDDQDRYVTWPSERFGLVGVRRTDYVYDAAGTRSALAGQVWGWYRRRLAVVDPGGPPSGLAFGALDAPVGDDGTSYLATDPPGYTIERYGLLARQVATYVHGDDGALAVETIDDHGWHSVELAPGTGYVNADGTSQRDEIEGWEHHHRTERRHYTDTSGRKRGETLVVDGYGVRETGYGWGRQVTHRTYQTRGNQSYDVVDVVDGRARPPETHLGQPPVPVYQSSPWTELVQDPLELILHDELLAQLFGPQSRVLNHPYIQSPEEAEAHVRRLLAREAAHQLRVQRPETAAVLGDTVLLHLPEIGFSDRCLVVAIGRRRAPGRMDADYLLESPALALPPIRPPEVVAR
ncbi:MAG: hypothetical protein AAGD06_27520 [Acidobacteriota bacterium]